MTERRAARMLTPRIWDTPDAKGFRAYAKEHYTQMLDFAVELLGTRDVTTASGLALALQLVPAVFDKLAAPLVYLYESWEVLSSEEKAKYSKELAEIHEKSEAMAKQLLPGVPVVTPEDATRIPKLDQAEIEALPWTSFKTKGLATKGEAGWIWRSLENAKELAKAIEKLEQEKPERVKSVSLQLGDMEYKFSGPEKQFIARRPVKV